MSIRNLSRKYLRVCADSEVGFYKGKDWEQHSQEKDFAGALIVALSCSPIEWQVDLWSALYRSVINLPLKELCDLVMQPNHTCSLLILSFDFVTTIRLGKSEGVHSMGFITCNSNFHSALHNTLRRWPSLIFGLSQKLFTPRALCCQIWSQR